MLYVGPSYVLQDYKVKLNKSKARKDFGTVYIQITLNLIHTHCTNSIISLLDCPLIQMFRAFFMAVIRTAIPNNVTLVDELKIFQVIFHIS